MPRIKVTAKDDVGFHPVSGNYLHKGEEYEIDESEFSDLLFDIAAPSAPVDENYQGGGF